MALPPAATGGDCTDPKVGAGALKVCVGGTPNGLLCWAAGAELPNLNTDDCCCGGSAVVTNLKPELGWADTTVWAGVAMLPNMPTSPNGAAAAGKLNPLLDMADLAGTPKTKGDAVLAGVCAGVVLEPPKVKGDTPAAGVTGAVADFPKVKFPVDADLVTAGPGKVGPGLRVIAPPPKLKSLADLSEAPNVGAEAVFPNTPTPSETEWEAPKLKVGFGSSVVEAPNWKEPAGAAGVTG